MLLEFKKKCLYIPRDSVWFARRQNYSSQTGLADAVDLFATISERPVCSPGRAAQHIFLTFHPEKCCEPRHVQKYYYPHNFRVMFWCVESPTGCVLFAYVVNSTISASFRFIYSPQRRPHRSGRFRVTRRLGFLVWRVNRPASTPGQNIIYTPRTDFCFEKKREKKKEKK